MIQKKAMNECSNGLLGNGDIAAKFINSDLGKTEDSLGFEFRRKIHTVNISCTLFLIAIYIVELCVSLCDTTTVKQEGFIGGGGCLLHFL